jgi:hypothetical protein
VNIPASRPLGTAGTRKNFSLQCHTLVTPPWNSLEHKGISPDSDFCCTLAGAPAPTHPFEFFPPYIPPLTGGFSCPSLQIQTQRLLTSLQKIVLDNTYDFAISEAGSALRYMSETGSSLRFVLRILRSGGILRKIQEVKWLISGYNGQPDEL